MSDRFVPADPARKKLVAVGAICSTSIFKVERIEPAPAKMVASRRLEVIDGMALSAAFAFVRLGGEAAMFGLTGDDERGRDVAPALVAEGIDPAGLRRVPGTATSHAAVIVDGRGDRLVVPFHDLEADRSANWLPTGRFAGADLVHCDLRWAEGAEVALRAAREMGIKSMIDGDVAPRELMVRLMPLADYAVFSDAGLAVFTGESDVDAGLRLAAATLPGHVGASCGADGYRWIEDGVIRSVPAPKVEVVDTLSAGDVFHGAFAHGLVEGWSIADTARFACAAASLKCTRFGGRLGCPTRPEVEALLENGAFRPVANTAMDTRTAAAGKPAADGKF
jgi:sulfofructose kinase